MQHEKPISGTLSISPVSLMTLWIICFLSYALVSCQGQKPDPENPEILSQGNDPLPTQTGEANEKYNSPKNSILGITFEYPAGWIWTWRKYEGANLETLSTNYPGDPDFGISFVVIPLEYSREEDEESCLAGVPTDENVVVVPPVTLERDETVQIDGYEARWIIVRREPVYVNAPVEIKECIEIDTAVNHISVVAHIPEDEREKWFGQGFDLIMESLEISP